MYAPIANANSRIKFAIGAYITYQLNLWGPMLKMTEAASQQALEEGKASVRGFEELAQAALAFF
jgi:hypothetical protein